MEDRFSSRGICSAKWAGLYRYDWNKDSFWPWNFIILITSWLDLHNNASRLWDMSYIKQSITITLNLPLIWDLPLINEFLKSSQTQQSWHEVIGCWTIAGWLMDWLTGELTERLFDSLEMKGKARMFFSPQESDVSGLTIPDHQVPKWTRLRWNDSAPLFSYSTCSFGFVQRRLLGSL